MKCFELLAHPHELIYQAKCLLVTPQQRYFVGWFSSFIVAFPRDFFFLKKSEAVENWEMRINDSFGFVWHHWGMWDVWTAWTFSNAPHTHVSKFYQSDGSSSTASDLSEANVNLKCLWLHQKLIRISTEPYIRFVACALRLVPFVNWYKFMSIFWIFLSFKSFSTISRSFEGEGAEFLSYLASNEASKIRRNRKFFHLNSV